MNPPKIKSLDKLSHELFFLYRDIEDERVAAKAGETAIRRWLSATFGFTRLDVT